MSMDLNRRNALHLVASAIAGAALSGLPVAPSLAQAKTRVRFAGTLSFRSS